MLRVVGTGHQEGSVETGFLQERRAHARAEIEEFLKLRMILDCLVSRHCRRLHRAIQDVSLTVTVALVGFAGQVVDFFHGRCVGGRRSFQLFLETAVHFHTHAAVACFHDHRCTVTREEILLCRFYALRVVTTVYNNMVVHHFDQQ